MAAPEQVIVDTVIISVILELESIPSLTEEQNMALKAFSRWKRCYRTSPDWLRQEFDLTG